MSPLTARLREFLDDHVVGALATRSAAGSVHQSLVYFVLDGEDLLISTEAQRRKALDVQETGWASLCVMGHERPFPSVPLSGRAEIRRDGIGPATARIAQRMLALYDPPEPQTDEALAGVGRVILAIRIERVGPASHLEPE
jgi:PPOX class probable F420-dependent enzyme